MAVSAVSSVSVWPSSGSLSSFAVGVGDHSAHSLACGSAAVLVKLTRCFSVSPFCSQAMWKRSLVLIGAVAA